MTEPNRFAVPLDQLEGVRVAESEQVTEQASSLHPDSSAWNGPLLHPFGDGMGTDADGE